MTEVVEKAPLEPGVEEFVTAASKEDTARKITMQYNFGASIQDSIDKFGAEVVHSMFVKSAVIALQANIRRLMNLEVPKTDEEIKAYAENEWKPGIRTPRATGSKLEKLIALLGSLTAEEKEKALAKLAESGM